MNRIFLAGSLKTKTHSRFAFSALIFVWSCQADNQSAQPPEARTPASADALQPPAAAGEAMEARHSSATTGAAEELAGFDYHWCIGGISGNGFIVHIGTSPETPTVMEGGLLSAFGSGQFPSPGDSVEFTLANSSYDHHVLLTKGSFDFKWTTETISETGPEVKFDYQWQGQCVLKIDQYADRELNAEPRRLGFAVRGSLACDGLPNFSNSVFSSAAAVSFSKPFHCYGMRSDENYTSKLNSSPG